MNKKEARIAKDKRNAKINYYIVMVSFSGGAKRLTYNFYNKKDGFSKIKELEQKGGGFVYLLDGEKRDKSITYE